MYLPIYIRPEIILSKGLKFLDDLPIELDIEGSDSEVTTIEEWLTDE